jgi:hypothetical protein
VESGKAKTAAEKVVPRKVAKAAVRKLAPSPEHRQIVAKARKPRVVKAVARAAVAQQCS